MREAALQAYLDRAHPERRGALPSSGALLLLTLTLVAGSPPTGADPELEGPWTGRADASPVPLEVELELEVEDGSWHGSVSIPSQGMPGLPADHVDVHEDSVTVAFEDFIELRLHRDGERLIGTLDGPEGEMDVELARPDTPAAEEWEEAIARALEKFRAEPLEPVREGAGLDRVDSDALEHLLEEARASNSTSLVVLHDGELVGEWHSGGEPRRVESMSVTKAVLNLVAGRLHTLGELDSLDMPVHRVYPEWSDGRRSEITVRHLLTHTSGLESPVPAFPIYESDDFVRFALESPLEEDPGTEFRYNNVGTNLLAGVLGELAGEPVDEFAQGDLFSLLGITDVEWTRDPAGNPHGMAGLQIQAQDLARLGQLALQDGEWEGEQLIDPEWFRKSLRPGSPHSDEVGLLWFLLWEDDREGEGEPVGFTHSGDLGQYLVVYPDEGLVGVRMVESSPAYHAETDAFMDFSDLLRDLAPDDG